MITFRTISANLLRCTNNSKPMKIFTSIVLVFILSLNAKSQDWHFSQFYYAPLAQDPALTGNMSGTARVGANYRSQWASITAPSVYSTFDVFADFQLMRGRFRGNSLGLGLIMLNDVAGDANLSTMHVQGSIAYHQSLDGTNNYHISFGLQGGFTQKGIDPSKLFFGNQFRDNGFNNNIYSGENLINTTIYADIGMGVAFSGQLNKYSQISFGLGAFHLNKPNESLKEKLQINQLYTKKVAHASATFGFNNKVYVFPAASYEYQGPSKEFVGGAAFGLNFTENKRKVGTVIYIGAFARYNESVIPTIGMITKSLKAGVSYDITTSTLARPTNGQGGFELAIIYNNLVQSKKMRKTYCPKF